MLHCAVALEIPLGVLHKRLDQWRDSVIVLVHMRNLYFVTFKLKGPVAHHGYWGCCGVVMGRMPGPRKRWL